MKIVMLVALLLLVMFFVLQIYTSMATTKSEKQAYKVIKEGEGFQIRYYPEVTMATISSNVSSYKDLGNSGFSKLAGYIFGGNNAKKQIAMTSPVHMYIGDTLSSMSFVMPANYTKDNLPLPNDSSVNIKTVAGEFVAAIEFDGFASDKKIKEYEFKLGNLLIANKISFFGHFRFLGYNPPYQLMGRKNEVVVSVNWVNQ